MLITYNKPMHTTNEVKDYLKALSEDFQHQLGLVAENVLGVHDKVGRMEKNIEIIQSDVADLKFDVSSLKREMMELRTLI